MKYNQLIIILIVLTASCVSKKKLTENEVEKQNLEKELSQLKSEKQECQSKTAALKNEILSYKKSIAELQGKTENMIELTENGQFLSEKSRASVNKILSQIPAEKVAQAQNLQDSINLAVAFNIKQNLSGQIDNQTFSIDDAMDVKVSEPVVMISLTDKILFKSGSYWVDKKAYKLLSKIADVIKNESLMDVRVVGHTDNRPIAENSYIVDNWDLSIRRAASVVRTLENKFGIEGKRLIASGQSKYLPVADNATPSGRTQNRRTTIMLLPNIKQFLSLINE